MMQPQESQVAAWAWHTTRLHVGHSSAGATTRSHSSQHRTQAFSFIGLALRAILAGAAVIHGGAILNTDIAVPGLHLLLQGCLQFFILETDAGAVAREQPGDVLSRNLADRLPLILAERHHHALGALWLGARILNGIGWHPELFAGVCEEPQFGPAYVAAVTQPGSSVLTARC